jgi:hypothetical protein
MLKHLRHRLTYANVMSTLAVFIALSGSSYAVVAISGRSIKSRSIPALKLKRNTLTGVEIKESALDPVPWARNAASLGGLAAEDFLPDCPPDTFATADVCVETLPRPPAPFGTAVVQCLLVDRPPGLLGRRLPTHNELLAALKAVQLAPGGELTSQVYPSSSYPGTVDALYVAEGTGVVAITPDTFEGRKAFRCVADPS